MTVYAHPADTITNCGGTLARHADAGDEIVALILTHGGRIHANRYAEEWRKDAPASAIVEAGLEEIIAFKKDELRRAAEIVGIGRVITLDRDDREAALHEHLVEDCFDSQGYSGLFARKLIEAANGEAGRAAGVNFAEGFYRLYNETHALLPVTAAAMADDPLVRHVRYSGVNLRAEHPMR